MKDKMEEEYTNSREEEISEMIRQVEETDTNRKHVESWKIIDVITSRKSTKKGIIKASNKEERLLKWYYHFSNLLGKEPTVTTDPTEEIPTILHDLRINDNQFTKDELIVVKKSLCN